MTLHYLSDYRPALYEVWEDEATHRFAAIDHLADKAPADVVQLFPGAVVALADRAMNGTRPRVGSSPPRPLGGTSSLRRVTGNGSATTTAETHRAVVPPEPRAPSGSGGLSYDDDPLEAA